MGGISMATPGASPLDLLNAGATQAPVKKPYAATQAKAKAAAQDFEAVFLNSMFQQMFTGIDGEGPFGGEGASGVWRSLLTDEYARSVAKRGGIGIADQVYKELLAHQEVRQ